MERAVLTGTIDRYCAAWNEPDAGRRAEILAAVWSEGATYTDPTVHATGAAELLAHIGKVRAARPGARIERTGDIASHHGTALFFWRLVLADGSPAPEGLDIVELAADGRRITRILGYFGPLPRLPDRASA